MEDIRILVVDDHPSVRDLLRALLEAEGYGVLEARDGSEGLEMAEREHPHLLILDLMMPDIDGERVIDELWKKDGFARMPVVVVSAKQEALDGVRELLGEQNVFSKPFEPTKLLDRIGELVGHPGDEESK